MPVTAVPRQFTCNTCSGAYADILADGLAFYHACPDVQLLGLQPDPTKPGYTPASISPRPNKRNENVQPGLRFASGQYFQLAANPLDPLATIPVPVVDPTIAQGTGRTQH